MRANIGAVLSLLVAGCSGDADVAFEDDEAVSTRPVTLRAVPSSGRLLLEDSPRFSGGTGEGLVCETFFRTDSAVRSTCRRGAELVEVIAKRTGGAMVVRRKAGFASESREYFRCTGTFSDPLPSSLRCRSVKPRSRTHGGSLGPALDSAVSGFQIPNASRVSSGVFRGMAPITDNDFSDLTQNNIESVLVFKNKTTSGHDVDEELARLSGMGIETLHIPFEWKSVASFETACKQTLSALRFIEAERRARKNVYFHCTVGEDRTGYLAALYRMRKERLSTREAFEGEMCERGYASGNPLKPVRAVVEKLQAALTPLYAKMAFKAERGELDALSDETCGADPLDDPAFAGAPQDLACGTATTFSP